MPLQIKDTAGLHGTKGDEVINSLAKLLEKVHRLEAKKRSAYDRRTPDLGEHIALAEAQCALLEEQLRYARRVLAFSIDPRSTSDGLHDVVLDKSPGYGDDDVFDSPQGVRSSHSEPQLFPPKAHQGTNTDVKKRVSRKTASKMPEATVPMKNPSHDRRARSTSAVPHTVRFPDHCRLTVADVPFILSKSTAASHSLPANLQNLVSLLKKAKPQSNVAKDFTDSIHRNVCVVGNGGLPRSNSEIDLRAASQPDAASRDLVHLMHQGEHLLKQLNQAQMPGTRHSLKCQCRRLISRIQAKMADIGKPEGSRHQCFYKKQQSENLARALQTLKDVQVARAFSHAEQQQLDARLKETAFSNGTAAKQTQKRKATVKPRSASVSSRGGDAFNRVFMRELRRIQSHLEQQI